MNPRIQTVAFLAVLAIGSSSGLSQAQLLEVTTASVTSSSGEVLEVTNAFVRVPELRRADGTSAGTVDLGIVRVRREIGASRRSAHVILAGGPGDSGVNAVMGLVRQGGPSVWQLFDGDVIGIDQRGAGRSRPNLETSVQYDFPLDRPGSMEAWLPTIQAADRQVAEAFRAQGIRLEAYNTRESADDVADVLRVLGYDQATLWGRSYGSHLALATVARHPHLVNRMVLIGPEGPNHTWKLPSHVDAVIDQLVARGATDLKTHMRTVVARLREQPMTITVPNPANGIRTPIVIGAFELQLIAAQALGDPRTVATLPSAFRDMSEGRFERVAQVALMNRARWRVDSAMKHMMDLSSGASADRQRQIQKEARDAVLGNAINFPGMFTAGAWAPVIDLGDGFRGPVSTAVPTLILAGDLDPRTPVANAREIAATLPAASVVVLENATHQFDVFGSDAVVEVIARFFGGERGPGTIVLPRIVFR